MGPRGSCPRTEPWNMARVVPTGQGIAHSGLDDGLNGWGRRTHALSLHVLQVK